MITALILGLVGGIVPGPVLAATFTEVLQSGFYKSLRIVFFAFLAETLLALISLLALSSLGLPESFFRVLSFVGAGILIWIATSLWKIKSLDSTEKVHFGPWKIAAMVFANGVLWSYWIFVCVPLAIQLGAKVPYGQFLFVSLVQFGWVLSTIGVALVFTAFRTVLSSPRAVPIMFKGFASVFIYFALTMIYGSVVFFFGR